MKKVVLLISLLFVICSVQAQDIFQQHGLERETWTLSQGRFEEIFPNKEVVQIGSVLIHTKTNKVVGFLDEGTEAAPFQPEHSSRALQRDPLARKFPWVSPYALWNNNPLRYIDPDGREWKNALDEKIAMQLQKAIANRDQSLAKREENINAKIDKIVSNTKMSNEQKSTAIAKQQEKLADVQTQRTFLAEASTGITQLGDSETVYTFNTVSADIEALLGSQVDGTVIINNYGTTGNRMHEVVHAIQYDNGAMTFNPLGSNNLSFNHHPSGLELTAYMTQYSLAPSSMPFSDHGSVKSIFGITLDWLWGVKNKNGKYQYRLDNYKSK